MNCKKCGGNYKYECICEACLKEANSSNSVFSGGLADDACEEEKEINPKCKICRSFNGDMEEPGCWLQKGTPDYLGEKCDFLQRGVS